MKIRTITIGIPGRPSVASIMRAGAQLRQAQENFESAGFEVQTRRTAFSHWDAELGKLATAERLDLLKQVDQACAEHGVDFCSIGMAWESGQIRDMAEALIGASRLSGSAEIGNAQRGLNRPGIAAAARAVLDLASRTAGGLGNFRFGAGCCLGPQTPFFPGSYHQAA